MQILYIRKAQSRIRKDPSGSKHQTDTRLHYQSTSRTWKVLWANTKKNLYKYQYTSLSSVVQCSQCLRSTRKCSNHSINSVTFYFNVYTTFLLTHFHYLLKIFLDLQSLLQCQITAGKSLSGIQLLLLFLTWPLANPCGNETGIHHNCGLEQVT